MSADLALILDQVDQLPISELPTLLEHIANRLRHQSVANEGLQNLQQVKKQGRIYLNIEGIERPDAKEIEAEMREIFTPEELAAMEKINLADLQPSLALSDFPTMTEIVSQGREEFFYR